MLNLILRTCLAIVEDEAPTRVAKPYAGMIVTATRLYTRLETGAKLRWPASHEDVV